MPCASAPEAPGHGGIEHVMVATDGHQVAVLEIGAVDPRQQWTGRHVDLGGRSLCR